MKTVLGIDPGWSGGAALLSDIRAEASKFTGKTEKDILETIKEYAMFADACFIEKVHSMPGQGVSSVFKFGHIYGFLRGVVMAAGVPMYEITPQKWQRSLGCLSKGNKNVTKARAQQIFPALKITHATADALLIATYGLQTLKIEEIK